MSEQLKSPKDAPNLPPKKRSFSKLAAATGAIIAVGVTGGAGLYNNGDKNSTIKHLKHESTDKTESLAAALAANFTAALYDHNHYAKGVQMPVLNGEIRTAIEDADGTVHVGVYKDPILLATDDIDAVPDLKGDFLKGGWVGIQGNDPNGSAVIHAQRFNASNETFIPYTSMPTDIIFHDLGVYATAVKGGPGLDIDGLVGFDLMGNSTLTNGDGSTITPGLSLGME